MADVSETGTFDQISINVDAQMPLHPPPPPQSPINNAEADRRAVFKVGLLMSLIAFGGILNPPIVTTTTITVTITNRAHHFLSMAFDFAIFFTLGLGVTQILLSILLCRIPELICVAKKMTEIGLAVMRVTLGFGTSLVLAAAAWFSMWVCSELIWSMRLERL